MPNHIEQAEELLKNIREKTSVLRAREAEAEARIAAIRDQCGPGIQALQEEVKGADRELKALMRREAQWIFALEDQVSLENGILLTGEERKVRIPRGALEAIKAQGWMEAVKVAESVDRGVVETWPEERLVVIGAERKTITTYSYEVPEEK